jgi:NDP-sugar pyrophosphorylase family protein
MLAGGKGVRLRPFTANFPKPLMPLGEKPVIEVLMRHLLHHGVTDITIALGHLAELVKAYFHHRREFTGKFDLRYVEEKEPTGTAGSLAHVRGLKKTFLMMNGDLLTDLNLHKLVAFHRRQGAALTIASHVRRVKIDLGVLEFGRDMRITGYQEKPEKTYHVSMGIYVFEPRVLKHIARGKYLDFPNLVLKLIAAGEKVSAFPTDCLWLDIGRPDDYAKAQELFAEKPEKFEHV